MPKFFVSPNDVQENFLVLTGENAAHAKVLRLQCGETVTVCDGVGQDLTCVVSDVSPGQISLVVQSREASRAEPPVACSVYMAYAKADKLEHVIQKATELGAYEIVAFPSARCVSRPDEKSLKKKLERWQKIAASAAEQSGRGRIPQLVGIRDDQLDKSPFELSGGQKRRVALAGVMAMDPQVLVLDSFHAALTRASKADKALMFYENEQAVTLKMALSGEYRTVSLLTGPEGGLEEKEVRQAREAGLQVCTLGKRILRCETAPLCALSAVMYVAGEF